MNKPIINICFKNNNGGLTLDASTIATTLESENFTVFYNGYPRNYRYVSKIRKIYPLLFKLCLAILFRFGKKKFAANIHLESIINNNINLAKKNIMIPNLEWLRESSYDLLSKIDLFICKTKHAKQFFDTKGLPAVYTSFSTISPHDNQYKQKPNTFIHIAGKSDQKGTIPLVQLWSKHPKWPKLTVLAIPTETVKYLKRFEVDNIEIIGGFLDRSKLKAIQNESEIHVCLSEAEGFGHSICEPLGCGAIIITVDGYPMNELIQPERGILIKSSHNEPMRHSRKFLFDSSDFEQKINKLLKMAKPERDQMKLNARKWFIDNDAFFQSALTKAVKECINK
jgi:glycosyl transferase family 1